jgi:hypothetical protein
MNRKSAAGELIFGRNNTLKLGMKKGQEDERVNIKGFRAKRRKERSAGSLHS